VSDPLEATLRRLRTAYLDESPARIAELEAQLARAGGGDAGAFAELARLLHRLAGSGGSYGIAGVTEAARAGEHLAERLAQPSAGAPPAELAALREHVAVVAAAFEHARRDPTPPRF